MVRRVIGRALARALLTSLLVPLPLPSSAGTTGRIQGRIVDQKRLPLPGVNVAIPAARLGAVSDADGRYLIHNVPAGTYEVKASLLGHRSVTVQSVVVSADNSTALDLTLEETALPLDEVVVTAKRPVVDLKLTSTLATLSREEIQSLPVQELQDIVNLQAGVVDGHFRGGRLGEVQFQVDGVSVNNAYDNLSSLRLDRSLLEEVQVISGTFDAEYGSAMSGVVNAVLRRGTEQFRWDAEALAGGFAFASGDRQGLVERRDPRFPRAFGDDFGPSAFGQRNFQLTMSGPLPLAKTFFLVNGRRYEFDDYVLAERRFTPVIGQVPDTLRRRGVTPTLYKVFFPDGDGAREPLGYTREWSGLAKITNRSLGPIELNYQAVVDLVNGRRNTWRLRMNPDGAPHQRTFSLVHGLDLTHTLTKSAFYNVSVRQNIRNYRDLVYDDVFDPRYDAAGSFDDLTGYANGAYVQGVDFARFTQNTNSTVVKGTLTNQWSRDLQFKTGAEFEWPLVRFGSPGTLVYATEGGVQRLVRHVDDPPKFPNVQKYRPYIAGAFGQTEVDWNDLRLRAGLRLDYFNARAGLPSDLANPANAIEDVPLSKYQSTTRKISFSPRLGVSYPVTTDAALFFAYGHFYQMPPIGDMFLNADYNLLGDLQAGLPSYRVMGNPDVRPQKTVQYQFGYKQALSDWFGVEANVFYKDIRDLLGVEFISTYNGAEYARATNVDFGSVVGFTVVLDQRTRGLFSSTLDYTWQRAQGNSNEPRETANRASAGLDPRPRVIPFNWDQRHTLNLTLTVARPKVFTMALVGRVASGQPYTPETESAFAVEIQNSGRKPAAAVFDLRSEKSLSIRGRSVGAFARVFNVLDSRFFNGFVFANTGSPYYERFSNLETLLGDPTRFYPPRRIEIGLTLRSEDAR